jgi:hypothetical protein
MSNEFTIALERELHRLESELRDDPRFRRINQIRALLADYQNGTGNAPVFPSPTVHYSIPTPASSRRVKRIRLSKATSVRMAVQQFLQEHGTTHRSVLLKSLIDQKILGREKNPMAALAAYLSDFKNYFEPDGRGNFSLKKSPSEGVVLPQGTSP